MPVGYWLIKAHTILYDINNTYLPKRDKITKSGMDF